MTIRPREKFPSKKDGLGHSILRRQPVQGGGGWGGYSDNFVVVAFLPNLAPKSVFKSFDFFPSIKMTSAEAKCILRILRISRVLEILALLGTLVKPEILRLLEYYK